MSGRLADLVVHGGYFQVGREADFPWKTSGKGVWYALLLVEQGRIVRCGFTSSQESKGSLVEALGRLRPEDEALLLGVWTGEYGTSLFVLDPKKAATAIRANLT